MAQFTNGPVIVAASDRMVTTGDIEFEQEQTKIFLLTTSITIMVAGDLTVQADVLHEVIAWKEMRLEAEPNKWLNVKDVADVFHSSLVKLTRRRAEVAILHPIGLDLEKLTGLQIAPDLGNQLTREVLQYQVAPIQAIVSGIDETGSHIYELSNAGVSCQDWTGFASIGAGAWHSNSQIMFANHVKSRSMAETIAVCGIVAARRRCSSRMPFQPAIPSGDAGHAKTPS